jgi:hypothetical protein
MSAILAIIAVPSSRQVSIGPEKDCGNCSSTSAPSSRTAFATAASLGFSEPGIGSSLNSNHDLYRPTAC